MKQPQSIEPMINENIPDDWENDDDDEENEDAVAPPVKHAPTPKAHTVWATKPVNLKSSLQNRALLAGQEHGGSFFDGGELGSMADDYDASRDSRTIWEAAYAPYFLYPALAPRFGEPFVLYFPPALDANGSRFNGVTVLICARICITIHHRPTEIRGIPTQCHLSCSAQHRLLLEAS